MFSNTSYSMDASCNYSEGAKMAPLQVFGIVSGITCLTVLTFPNHRQLSQKKKRKNTILHSDQRMQTAVSTGEALSCFKAHLLTKRATGFRISDSTFLFWLSYRLKKMDSEVIHR